MKRWLALRRWRLLGLTVGIVGIRVIIALLLHIVDDAYLPPGVVRTAVVTVCDISMCVATVATILAFVQYGRIYNARIPTE